MVNSSSSLSFHTNIKIVGFTKIHLMIPQTVKKINKFNNLFIDIQGF